ncbi:D-tyrosyl-tRNA(Tyr) deacylase [bacterium]|nr:D-tyrosyl-tRNA(Tyr) deacylase [bacterium]
MRAVLQRVSSAGVEIDGATVGSISAGLVILLAVHKLDSDRDILWMAEKCAHLRIFENSGGKFDRSLLDTGGEALVVSQFTLYGNCRRGRRPDFLDAAGPDIAVPAYEKFILALKEMGIRVATGRFGARMSVRIENEGPVTVILDSREA